MRDIRERIRVARERFLREILGPTRESTREPQPSTPVLLSHADFKALSGMDVTPSTAGSSTYVADTSMIDLRATSPARKDSIEIHVSRVAHKLHLNEPLLQHLMALQQDEVPPADIFQQHAPPLSWLGSSHEESCLAGGENLLGAHMENLTLRSSLAMRLMDLPSVRCQEGNKPTSRLPAQTTRPSGPPNDLGDVGAKGTRGSEMLLRDGPGQLLVGRERAREVHLDLIANELLLEKMNHVITPHHYGALTTPS